LVRAALGGMQVVRCGAIDTDITGTDITGAVITGTDITGAVITGAYITGAHINCLCVGRQRNQRLPCHRDQPQRNAPSSPLGAPRTEANLRAGVFARKLWLRHGNLLPGQPARASIGKCLDRQVAGCPLARASPEGATPRLLPYAERAMPPAA
jgi:uncharacterized protein YjbI with pentapeptide repeats